MPLLVNVRKTRLSQQNGYDGSRCGALLAYPDPHGGASPTGLSFRPTKRTTSVASCRRNRSALQMDECCLPPLDSRCGDCAESNLSRLAEPPPQIRFKLPSRSSFRDKWVGNIHALFPALIPTDPFFGLTRIRVSTPFAVLNDQSTSSMTPASSAECVSCVHQLMV